MIKNIDVFDYSEIREEVNEKLNKFAEKIKEVNQLEFVKEIYPRLFGNPILLKDCIIIINEDLDKILKEMKQ